MTKKTKEFRSLTVEEIKNHLNELRKEIMKENVQVSSGTAPVNPGKLRQSKKNVARLFTVLAQKSKGGKINKHG
jgi:large subunit ribosomal protein L29